MNPYVSLHAHVSNGSIGDSIIKIDEYIEKAKELNLPAIAVTDHGSMSAVYEFYHACKEADIKPIIGCEVYETSDRLLKEVGTDRFHLLLIAINDTGFKNLLKIATNAYTEGFYSKPRTDLAFMREHGEGIVATSACVAGRLPKAIVEGRPDEELVKMIEQYKETFEAFYLEIQPGRFLEQQVVNQKLIELSKRTNTPIIVTNDIHYLNAEDALPHDAHVKIARKQQLSDPQVYVDSIYYMMDREELINVFDNSVPVEVIEEGIQSALDIIEASNINMPHEVIMPKLNDVMRPSDTEIMKRCLDELEKISDTIDINLYTDRLMKELDVIRQLGFSDYFLVVQDFLAHAKEEGISTGPGRGSVAGSLVAYLLGITVPDPIKYGLLFERFLSAKRAAMPDIDLDFDANRRAEMFDYVAQKYGQDHCALVSTVQIRKSKRAIRDIGRIFDIDKDTVNRVAGLIPTVIYDDEGEKETDLSIKDAIEAVPELQQYAARYPAWFRMASRLSDIPANKSIHAAGILLAPVSLSENIPMVRSNNENIMATSLTLHDAESAGFVKFDFLSLASLYVYDQTMKDVGIDFDYRTNNFDDEATWDLIGSDKTTGLFQISSSIYKSRMGKLKPRSIEELAACLALLRGPCISIGADKDYMDIIAGKKQPEYIHELYWDVTKETNGVLLYQEQIMKLATNVGFDQEDSYKLMKTIAKKKPEQIAKFRDKFYELASSKQVPEYAIDRMWHIVEVAGQYCFNKSHAVAYAMLSYCSAYLKAHYPLHFLKNLLTNAANRKKEEEIQEAIIDCRRHGIQFLPAHINHSKWEFTVEGDKIRVGFSVIKGFGDKAYDALELERNENGPFENLTDFVDRIPKRNCNKGAIIALIFGGAFFETEGSLLDEKEIYTLYMEEIRREDIPESIRVAKETFTLDSPIEDIERLYLIGNFIHDEINALPKGNWHQQELQTTAQTQGTVAKTSRKKDANDEPYVIVTLSSGDGMLELIGGSEVLATSSKLLRKNKHISLTATKTGLNTGFILEVEELS